MPAETGERRVKGMAMPAAAVEQEQLPCPRCDSTNTKFCYYNNYNFSQPRHFCKSCRRYWTHGGTLRDIPVGGATRKNNAKRSRILPPTPPSSSSTTLSTASPSFLSSDVFLKPPTFTSLLTSSPSMAGPGGFLALGGLGLGIGPGFEDAALGFGRPLWAFPEVGYIGAGVGGIGAGGATAVGNGNGHGGGMMNMWQQLDQSDQSSGGFAAGDCLSWPDLAISTPGNGLK